ncbi:PadR family transcriptional regulator [Natronomonas marina]|jgi:DNA-binding PadR family transcriptional regulator|uniref:PadR family transcriptional regulator n=1 Tax=Natronomonas marina TaxID=2961939 RepID=UPI0020C9DFB2|nr:PadR family transcriptional regulator [Natronomonas marina]
MRWLNSGLRRDVCILLAEESYRQQQLKVALEDHYDDRIDAKQFRGALERLVEAGFVEREVDGIHDVYSLTGAGRDALDAHYEWMTEKVA